MRIGHLAIIAIFIMVLCIMSGCGKSDKPPYNVKEIQAAGDYLSEGYDIYKNVAFPDKYPAGISPDKVSALLDYYEEKYKDQKRVKVMIFRDAAAAVQGITNLIVGELEMVNGEVILRSVNIT